MTEGPYFAEAAALIGDPARANMLAALMDGRALTASELAYRANVAPSTASGHLAKLVEGKLVSPSPSGRHRYYRLASSSVAGVLENLMALAVEGPPRYRPPSRCDEAMARARTCYDQGGLGRPPCPAEPCRARRRKRACHGRGPSVPERAGNRTR